MNHVKIKRMTGIALLMALVVVLQFVGGMIPPMGGFTISLVLIPIVLGAAIYGPRIGALLGATFGTVVFINCVTGTDPGGAMVLQANPVICFFVVMAKGILAGFVSGSVYAVFKKWNPYVAMFLAAAVCPMVNTGLFVACMLTFYQDVLSVWAGGGDLITYVLSGLMLCNFVPELIINLVFSPAGQRILMTVNK